MTTQPANSDLQFGDGVAPQVRTRAWDLLEGWQVPGSGPIAVDVLAGGANNVNLVVTRGGNRWCMKIRDANAASFNASLKFAVEGQKEAARLGVAPDVLLSLYDGSFISEHVSGVTLRPQIIREGGYAPKMVETLRKLHDGYPPRREFDIFDDIRVFMRNADEIGGVYPKGYQDFWTLAQRFESILLDAKPPKGFGHNDLVPQNFIATDTGIKLVDFDYCGRALIAVDLAGVTSQAEMTEDETQAFLRLYDPGLDEAQIARVQCLKFINSLREVSWAVMAEPQMSDKTALLDGWSYQYHLSINMELAENILRSTSVDRMAELVGQVRPGALF